MWETNYTQALKPWRRLPSLAICCMWLSGCATLGNHPARPHLDKHEELDAIRRAEVWSATDVAAMDIRNGPPEADAFPPQATVRCRFVDRDMKGHTPKFTCAIGDDEMKVKYGRDNGEVYAEVASTRLFWALGFGADREYPVRVICEGCPSSLHADRHQSNGSAVFDYATIERKMKGRELLGPKGEGWSWSDLDRVSPESGGAPLEQRDALKLLAVLIQHTDSKPNQQRLSCLDKGRERERKIDRSESVRPCDTPFMLINDLGMTFGKANAFNRGSLGSVNLEAWRQTPVWRDRAGCVGNLKKSLTGTLDNPEISEEGRRFLADRLSKLTDRQIHDLFDVSRFESRTNGREHPSTASVQDWADAFKTKIAEIAGRQCPDVGRSAAAQ